MTEPNCIITTRRIKAKYEHFIRMQNAQRTDLGTAVAILHDTRSLRKRWTGRHRRRWAKRTIRSAVRGGLTAWFERDPFVWPPPGEKPPEKLWGLDALINSDVPPGGPFWATFKQESEK